MGKNEERFGLRLSTIDGSEHIYTTSQQRVPQKYSYIKILPDAKDQGNLPFCVPFSVESYFSWRETLNDGEIKDVTIDKDELYNSKDTEEEGMTFKEAFYYLRHHGVSSDEGNLEIKEYAMVRSAMALKYAIIMNGPCLSALPVYSYGHNFWDSKTGRLKGYHAISIVGYDEEGFIIRNSWGRQFADYGYTKLPYDSFKKLMEVWTIIS